MPSRRITFPLSFGAMQMSDICCLLNVRVSSCLSLRIMFREQQIAKETFLLLGCNTFERYFINGEWNRQRGQKLTCYIVRAIHWTGRNTQHEPRNCTDLHSECTRTMRSLTAIVVFARAILYVRKKQIDEFDDMCSFFLSRY